MKFRQKSETVSDSKIDFSRLEDHAGYRDAARKLEQLKNELVSQKAQLARKDICLARVDADVRLYLTKPIANLPTLPTPELNSIAEKIIAAGGVRQDLLRELRTRAPHPNFADEYNERTVSEYGDTKATIELLGHAIKLHEKEVDAQKLLAAEQFNASRRDERQRIVSKLADAMIQLSQAITDERRFEKFLSLCDPVLARTMRPGLFPIRLLENPDVYRWLKESVDEGMLSGEQKNALGRIFSESESLQAVNA